MTADFFARGRQGGMTDEEVVGVRRYVRWIIEEFEVEREDAGKLMYATEAE